MSEEIDEKDAAIEDMARTLYRSLDWSGCAGSDWDRIAGLHVAERYRDAARALSGDSRTEARDQALREAADLVNRERTAHLIASTRAPAAAALFRAEQAILARVTPPAECDCDGDDEMGHDYLCPALRTHPTSPIGSDS